MRVNCICIVGIAVCYIFHPFSFINMRSGVHGRLLGISFQEISFVFHYPFPCLNCFLGIFFMRAVLSFMLRILYNWGFLMN